MNKQTTGVLLIISFLAAGSAIPPYHKDPHVEQEPITPESALYAEYMDAAILNTFSGTTATIGQFSIKAPQQFK